jgi:nitroimidazol reductase NimA-like FMN-containing flavoprotein (pyridoxamine 5'-phosphate oxidase superfamily)
MTVDPPRTTKEVTLSSEDPTVTARQMIDTNRYLTLATADGAGRPWACPVWFAHENYTRFVWVSRPTARHSQNINGRPEVSAVIFDSTVPEGQGQAVYLEATAEQLDGEERDQAIGIFSGKAVAFGIGEWHPDRVTEPAELRVYRATVSASYVLDPSERRVPVRPGT